MKRNLYLIAAGLVLASCTEPGDVVTGYARVITKNQPVIAAPVAKPVPAPVAAAQPVPAPVQYQVITEPAPQPVPQPERAVVSQNQPVVAAPAAVPAPASVVAKPTPVAAPIQQAPVASRATVITKSTPAPAAAPAPAPAVVQQTTYTASRPTYTTTVSQQQPAVSAPPAQPNWRTPQQVNPQKKAYPTMPGQNRGLRSKKINKYYY